MSLSTGELSNLDGKLLLMTATATKKTIRILKSQFTEISRWELILNLPVRENVTMLIPPPDTISTNYTKILAPFVLRMHTTDETYLILVRGKHFY